MKEWPTIFSSASIRAILDGRKTQTRRVIKPQPEYDEGLLYCDGHYFNPSAINAGNDRSLSHLLGQVGDLLWVREAIRASLEQNNFYYSADSRGVGDVVYEKLLHKYGGFSRSGNARYMPKCAARIWPRITSIRVERVQEIGEADANAEGVLADLNPPALGLTYRDGFRGLWDSINAKRGFGWDPNPWVRVVEFQVEDRSP